MKAVDYSTDLLNRLKSPVYARRMLQHAFLQSCKDANWAAFGMILQDVIEAQGSKTAFAKKAKISRQHLYRMCKKNANPTIQTLLPLLDGLGLELRLSVK